MTQHRVTVPRLSRILPMSAALLGLVMLGGCAGMYGKVPKDFRGGYARGDKVLVMLPSTGPVAKVADAVREGVLAASEADNTGARPQIAFANSADPNSVASSYDKGVADSATQVIGPLLKPSVKVLGSRDSLPVTTLALNELSGAAKPPANLFQFTLRPENEAINVANKAHAQGFTRALMLYPDDRGGSRRASAFRQQWKTKGGTLVAELTFKPSAANAATVISKLLAAGKADFVFLAGDETQALALYPRLREATPALPVIAPGIVYSGMANPKRDQALDGLYFVDMPWMLGAGPEEEPLERAALKAGAPYLDSPIGWRLYAMGIDAYRMAPRVAAMAADPKKTFPGQTGTLSVDFNGRIKRELTLARFTASGPQAVETIKADADRGPHPEPATRG